MRYASLRPERLIAAREASDNGAAQAWDLPTIEDTIALMAERDRLREALTKIEALDRAGHWSESMAEAGYIARAALSRPEGQADA